MGIACAQQDVARVYPLPDDPERCLEDFLEHAADHARARGRAARPPGAVGASASSSSPARASTRPPDCAGRGADAPPPPRRPDRARLRAVRLPRPLVPARARADRRRAPSAAKVLDVLEAQARGDARRGPRAAARVRAPSRRARSVTRARTAELRAPGPGRDPQLRAEHAALAHPPGRDRARRVARGRRRCRSSSACACGARGR